MPIVSPATCLGCGCACDDIDVVVRDNRIVEARNACPLGAAWFGNGQAAARARVDGRDRTLDAALDEAAARLGRATRRLVYLAPELSCEAQREGVAIADALRARLDTVTADTVMTSVLAQQERGRAGATLGEIRNRADVLVFWGVDPAVRYPRFSSRYAPEPAGLHVPDGRASRTIVAVDVDDARGPADADVRVSVPAADEVATLTALTALVLAGNSDTPRLNTLSRRVPGSDPGTPRHQGQTPQTPHTAWDKARELIGPLLAGRYVVIVADAEPPLPPAAARDAGRADALIRLSQTLNAPTRCALSLLRAGGNRSGADAVLTWQTGFPAAVDFARGYPRYTPEDTADDSGRHSFDAALILGSAVHLSDAVRSRFTRVPCIVMGPGASDGSFGDRGVAIDTGLAGVHEGGTAVRMDDVPVHLRPSIAGPPDAATLARALRERITAGVHG